MSFVLLCGSWHDQARRSINRRKNWRRDGQWTGYTVSPPVSAGKEQINQLQGQCVALTSRSVIPIVVSHNIMASGCLQSPTNIMFSVLRPWRSHRRAWAHDPVFRRRFGNPSAKWLTAKQFATLLGTAALIWFSGQLLLRCSKCSAERWRSFRWKGATVSEQRADFQHRYLRPGNEQTVVVQGRRLFWSTIK